MSLDSEDFGVFQNLVGYLKDIKETQEELLNIKSQMLQIATLNARREFLLLTMSPDRVRDQLVEESGAYLDPVDRIVAKPE